jgi:hypothetical protein
MVAWSYLYKPMANRTSWQEGYGKAGLLISWWPGSREREERTRDKMYLQSPYQ